MSLPSTSQTSKKLKTSEQSSEDFSEFEFGPEEAMVMSLEDDEVDYLNMSYLPEDFYDDSAPIDTRKSKKRKTHSSM